MIIIIIINNKNRLGNKMLMEIIQTYIDINFATANNILSELWLNSLETKCTNQIIKITGH